MMSGLSHSCGECENRMIDAGARKGVVHLIAFAGLLECQGGRTSARGDVHGKRHIDCQSAARDAGTEMQVCIEVLGNPGNDR